MSKNIVIKKIYEFKFFIFLSIFLFLIETFLVSCSTLLIAPLIDYFNKSPIDDLSKVTLFLNELGIPNQIYFILTLFFLFFTFSYLFKILTFYFSLKFKFQFLIELNQLIYNSIVNANWNFIKNQKSGNLINLIKQELEKIGNIFMSLSRLFADFIQVSFLLFSAFLVDFKIASSTIIILLIALMPFVFLKKISKNYGRISFKASSSLSENLNNLIRNTKIIITNNLGNFFLTNYLKEYKVYARSATFSQTLINGMPQIVYPIGVFVLISIILIFINQTKSITDITVIFFIFYRIIPLITAIISNYNTINNVIPVLNEFQNIYNQSQKNQTKNFGEEFIDLNKNITFKEVCYRHSDEKKFFFNNLNFIINKNTIFGIIGDSGSGKSTLIDILTGNLKINSGKILFDEVDINNLNLKKFRDNISIIGQDVPIFNDTIVNNLFISEKDLDLDYIKEILLITGVSKLVNTFQYGYETYIGNGGIILSGGQKQRIALARALIRVPKVLILDEFISALDEITQDNFLNMMVKIKNKTTIIMITHNLKTTEIFDSYIKLDYGSIIEYEK